MLLGVSALGIYAAGQQALASDTTTFSYDALGRLVATSIAGGPNNGMKSSTLFDSNGNRTHYQTGTAISTPTPSPTPTPTSNLPPTATDDNLYVPCYNSATVNLTANDSDPEGNTPLVLQSITLLSGSASATKISNSSVSVNASSSGPYDNSTFSYVVADSLGATSTGRLYVNVQFDSNYCGGGA